MLRGRLRRAISELRVQVLDNEEAAAAGGSWD